MIFEKDFIAYDEVDIWRDLADILLFSEKEQEF